MLNNYSHKKSFTDAWQHQNKKFPKNYFNTKSLNHVAITFQNRARQAFKEIIPFFYRSQISIFLVVYDQLACSQSIFFFSKWID